MKLVSSSQHRMQSNHAAVKYFKTQRQNLILTKKVIVFLLDEEDNTLPDKVTSDVLLKESHP